MSVHRMSIRTYDEYFFRSSKEIAKSLLKLPAMYQGVNIRPLYLQIAKLFNGALLTPKEFQLDLEIAVELYSKIHSLDLTQSTIQKICEVCFHALSISATRITSSPLHNLPQMT